MFIELRSNGKSLLCPLNTYATHGETRWLSPLYKTNESDLLTEWEKHMKNG